MGIEGMNLDDGWRLLLTIIDKDDEPVGIGVVYITYNENNGDFHRDVIGYQIDIFPLEGHTSGECTGELKFGEYVK